MLIEYFFFVEVIDVAIGLKIKLYALLIFIDLFFILNCLLCPFIVLGFILEDERINVVVMSNSNSRRGY